jgi:copper(I)-binding protein
MKHFLLVLTFVLALTSDGWAQSSGSSIKIEHAWARAAASAGGTGAAYVTIANAGPVDDRLVAAASAVAAKTELHLGMNENGVMKMEPVSAIDIKAGGQTVLKPGGVHIMLIDLKQPLKVGDTFSLTLIFEKAGKIETQVMIEKAGSMGDMKM